MHDEVAGEQSALERVRRIRGQYEALMQAKGFDKPSVADYARLLQLERELEGETPKDITVQWVETFANDETE